MCRLFWEFAAINCFHVGNPVFVDVYAETIRKVSR